MLHKQTPTACMFVNADEFIKKKSDNMKLAATKSSRQLRVSACQGWLRNKNHTLQFRHYFPSSVYIFYIFFLSFFLSVILWRFLSLIFSDEDKIELAVINPAYVMGPVINGSMSTSSEVSRSTKQKTTKCISQSDSSLSYHLSKAQGVCFSTFLAWFSVSQFPQHSSYLHKIVPDY